MSADNGIYILETDGPEFRVKHLQAVEDVYGDTDHDTLRNAQAMWREAKVFTEKTAAYLEADRQAEGCDVLEYGISVIRIAGHFINGLPKERDLIAEAEARGEARATAALLARVRQLPQPTTRLGKATDVLEGNYILDSLGRFGP